MILSLILAQEQTLRFKMCADNTKIWRQMECLDDHITLQRDVNYLIDWSLRNKMNFHPSKCKVLKVSKFKPTLMNDFLVFSTFTPWDTTY